MQTYHVHINGIVQGVGFRPMVYQAAKEMQLNGYVKNGSDGVHIYFNASEETANLFFKKILQNTLRNQKLFHPNYLHESLQTLMIFQLLLIDERQVTERSINLPRHCDLC